DEQSPQNFRFLDNHSNNDRLASTQMSINHVLASNKWFGIDFRPQSPKEVGEIQKAFCEGKMFTELSERDHCYWQIASFRNLGMSISRDEWFQGQKIYLGDLCCADDIFVQGACEEIRRERAADLFQYEPELRRVGVIDRNTEQHSSVAVTLDH
ncbi:MAG: hypothetical protein Q9169_008054, partial [Polycauliona sp. 2 TL-2023]